MTEHFNRDSEKPLRQRLRREMPTAELLLWSRLKSRQLFGFRFRRQYSVGPFCVDFFCPQAQLAVEVDGDCHFTDEARRRDASRQQYIENLGIRFVRCTNLDVIENL